MNLLPVVWVPGSAKKRVFSFTERLSNSRFSMTQFFAFSKDAVWSDGLPLSSVKVYSSGESFIPASISSNVFFMTIAYT